MKHLFLYLFLLQVTLNALDFKVASYNVENLFDLKYQGTEYKEYIPCSEAKPHSQNTKCWNKKAYNKKFNNITKVINDLDSDIIALQEIESQIALKELIKNTPQYKYHKFLKSKSSSVGVALLSKYPIVKSSSIIVDKNDLYARDILKATVSIKNKLFIIYVNHWRSKRAKESHRVIYATALKNDIDKLDSSIDYIILGDLNSNYNEYQTFKYDKRLNNTYGITGINQILNTTIKGNFISKSDLLTYKKKVHYNLWLEINEKNRFSSMFKRGYDTPDHIIISPALIDNKNISYIYNSFKVFKPHYLYNNNKIQRWNRYKYSGYSDHLPIYASFSTSNQSPQLFKNRIDSNSVEKTISSLYKIEQINKSIDLKNVVLIYKTNKIAVIKQLNNRAIMIYKPHNSLKLGYRYNITINEIDQFNGLKEITKISDIKKISSYKNYKNLYLNAIDIDLFSKKYQNEIVKNLKGTYKKGYLYFRDNVSLKRIKLYFDKKIKRPDNGKNITINSGHLGIYKSQIQIKLYRQSDFD